MKTNQFFEFFQKINFDTLSAIIFLLALSIFLYSKRDKIKIEKIIGFFIYLIRYDTTIGIKFMEKISSKYRELIKLIGYCFIGFGFFGILFVSITLIWQLFIIILKPKVEEAGVALVLPFTTIPGIGYLSFWYFLISIFILAIVHEFAHGVIAKAHGLKIKKTGFAIFGIGLPLLPAAFVEPDEKELKKKSDIIQYSIYAAGPMANIILAIIVLIPFIFLFIPITNNMTENVGFSFVLVDENDVPSKKAGMINNSIITSINNIDIKTFSDFRREMLRIKPGEQITIIADDIAYNVNTINHPEDNNLAYVGIHPSQNEIIINDKYKGIKSTVFFWFKDLFMWLFLLNLGIGLMNLLPAGPLDGGHMTRLAFKRLFKNEKTGLKFWKYIGIFFLFVILFMLFTSYIFNPFSLIF
ncbi:MAG: site-2 protease family protein [Candidatus Woesearchaeota archaeon]